MVKQKPLITLAVPSYNQGNYLEQALRSIFSQSLPIEVFVLDGGSQDQSISIIKKWEPYLAGWRSYPDQGQTAAINEGIAQGNAPFVGWLNSDDWLLPKGLSTLLRALQSSQFKNTPFAYGQSWNFYEKNHTFRPVWVEPFYENRLALRCIISQPATLIRRFAWEEVRGVSEQFQLAMDYDLWWRLFRRFGSPHFIDQFIAVNRVHTETKTNTQPRLHYQEAIKIVRQHYGEVPLKWWFFQPYRVWLKSIMNS
ncbi:glycosyltransferase [Candidatus Nitrosacidococcus tergens]|uniref:Glycosyl transferase family 2 n=1 Tax=Candidatus Nitrosacidococcus tergens TaxID=553981 RepID=A0A7G1Q913_9GAMM|nr:glycosyltransferase [Candidatus Nitrosacidococcus tergens]CAB1275130.1 Glycosyl transferase family 2 [Candidatus Nitrosacidococcus tergens]